MRLSELSGKEVINLSDGARLGAIGECELAFDERTGKIMAIMLPSRGGILNIFGEGKHTQIPWHTLKRIGDEVVIVELNESQERYARISFEK